MSNKLKLYNPFALSSLVDNTLDDSFFGSFFKINDSYNNVKFYTHDKSLVITIEAPGFSEEEIKISLKGRVLSVKGDSLYNGVQRSITHSFNVPNGYNLEGSLEAKLEKGILTISLPHENIEPVVEPDTKNIPVKSV